MGDAVRKKDKTNFQIHICVDWFYLQCEGKGLSLIE